MNVTVHLPDDLIGDLGGAATVPRRLLEALAADAYRSGTLTRAQVGRLLGLGYWQTDSFLAEHDARRPYTLADLEVDRRSLNEALKSK